MTTLIRFGVSLEKTLLERFDDLIAEKQYTNRSEAIRDLIRESLVREEWEANREVTGAITIVYDHHKRELVNLLMNVQHDYHDTIISTQHIHLDHHNCLEVIVVKGKSQQAEALFHALKSAKGVKHAGFTITTTGKNLT
jgi:CopG family nickel-responsive transcriptional regulator